MKIKSLILLTIVGYMTLLCISCTQSCPDVGQSAPDFTIQDINGENVSLSDFRGKTVVLNFWATWCVPCKSETPFFEAVHSERAGEDIVILAIDLKENAATVKSFVSAEGLSFPILLDTEAKVAAKYCLPSAIPITIFINSEGIIKARKVGAFRSQAELESMIDSL